MWIRRVYRSWEAERSVFGDAAVVAFLIVQCLDGVFTYLGVAIWGPRIEANPIVASAITAGGPTLGLFGMKAVAVGFGMLLHLRRVHTLVAILTAVYFAVAIIPWAALFLVG
jgi:Domain of unknown function (DUF5658)